MPALPDAVLARAPELINSCQPTLLSVLAQSTAYALRHVTTHNSAKRQVPLPRNTTRDEYDGWITESCVLLFGETTARSDRRRFGIRTADRLSHIYIIGKTGTGKSSLLESMIMQDLLAGRGLALIDPHGDLADRLEQLARPRRDDLVVVDLSRGSVDTGYNPLLHVSAELRPLVASGVLDLFKLLWSEAWGVRMEHILRNALLALLEQPNATFADILRLISERKYRLEAVGRVSNEQVKRFWLSEYPNYSMRYQADGIAPIQNKVGAFLADPRLRQFLTAGKNSLRLRTIMDEGQVLIVNLAQGKIGSDSASLLGGLLVTALGSAAFSRANIPETERRPFFIYVDEFQNFTTLAVANMLAELRKYQVSMCLGHQYLSQLLPEVRDAVLGNAGTVIAFRLGAADAAVLAKELAPIAEAADLVGMPNRHALIRLLVDGQPLRPFSFMTLPR